MNKLIYGVIVSIIISMMLFTNTIEGDVPPKYFKVFPNGVTYVTNNGAMGFWNTDNHIDILYNGTTYDCQPTAYHENQYLSPICVEIILRSLP